MKGLGLLSAPLDDQGLTTQHYSLFRNKIYFYKFFLCFQPDCVQILTRAARTPRSPLPAAWWSRELSTWRRPAAAARWTRTALKRGWVVQSSNIETETQEGVSAVLVLKALCESKMALLFEAKVLHKSFFCKHKETSKKVHICCIFWALQADFFNCNFTDDNRILGCWGGGHDGQLDDHLCRHLWQGQPQVNTCQPWTSGGFINLFDPL